MSEGLRVAVVVDQPEKGQLIEKLLVMHGYQLALCEDIKQLAPATVASCETDLWLLAMSEDVDLPILDDLLDQETAPVLIGEGKLCSALGENFALSGSLLISKVIQTIGAPQLQTHYDFTQMPAPSVSPLSKPDNLAEQHQVWLLAGDSGAITSVTEFLALMPEHLPVTFIYAQHMQNQPQQLVDFLRMHIQLPVELAEQGQVFGTGQVLIAPELPICSLQAGQIHLDDTVHGNSVFKPSIDSVLTAVAQENPQVHGAIFFSGYGIDGCVSLPYAKRQGIQLWAQQAQQCEVPYLPEYIANSGADFVGSVSELAQHFLNHLAKA